MIELVHVTKRFGDFVPVENLSLAVPQGEFFGFLGPNGAGKTTTIKMMAGLFAPATGTIMINGHDTVREPIDAKKSLSYVPDQPFLYDKRWRQTCRRPCLSCRPSGVPGAGSGGVAR